MTYYRTQTGERVYFADGKMFPSRPNDKPEEMLYRARDGHALWGYTRKDVVLESVWLTLNAKKKKSK